MVFLSLFTFYLCLPNYHLFLVPELHQALRRIGRDDIVHKLQRGDLDSDSLRLIDSSNLHLDRTSVSSKDDVRLSSDKQRKFLR